MVNRAHWEKVAGRLGGGGVGQGQVTEIHEYHRR